MAHFFTRLRTSDATKDSSWDAADKLPDRAANGAPNRTANFLVFATPRASFVTRFSLGAPMSTWTTLDHDTRPALRFTVAPTVVCGFFREWLVKDGGFDPCFFLACAAMLVAGPFVFAFFFFPPFFPFFPVLGSGCELCCPGCFFGGPYGGLSGGGFFGGAEFGFSSADFGVLRRLLPILRRIR